MIGQKRGRPAPTPLPPINKIYSGPSIPAVYDSNWQYFTNLTKDQIAWFQAQPEWQNFLAYVAASPATAVVAASPATVNAALTAVKTLTTIK